MAMTTNSAKRTTYHHGDLRAELVRIGRILLETERNPSLRSIARRAEVSHGAPVHHFPTWAHLLAACAADGFRELSRDLEAVAAIPHYCNDTLIEMSLAYLAFAKRAPVVFRLMFNRDAVTERTEEFQRESSAAYAFLESAIRGLDPEMSHACFDRTLNTVWALIHGMSVLEIEGQICRSDGLGTETSEFLREGLQRLIGRSQL